MAATWVKSLQCKSRAFDDVIHPSPKLPSCKNSYQNLKDVIDTTTKPKPKPKPWPEDPKKRHSLYRRSSSRPNPGPNPSSSSSPRVRRTVSAPIINKSLSLPSPSFYPNVSELQVGHPSRNVVEIIFQTRWGGGPRGFPGRVTTVLKIHNPPRTLSHFEDYRASIKALPGPTAARCSADGNEMMRFRCGDYCGGGEKAAICTYSGSGAAHESGGRGGRGRFAMLVCRVIAGRVRKKVGPDPDVDGSGLGEFGYDSVSGDNGELLVFDNRAVLPCFLVVYKL